MFVGGNGRTRRKMYDSRTPGRPSQPGERRGTAGNEPGRGGPHFRSLPPVGERLDIPVPRGRVAAIALGSPRAPAHLPPRPAPGRHRRPADHRPVSGPAEAALRVVDARGGGAAPFAAVRAGGVGVDGGTVPGELGLLAPEAGAVCVREEPRGGEAMDSGGAPRHPVSGQA